MRKPLLCAILFSLAKVTKTTTLHSSRGNHPCSTVSCYFNAMCVIDSSTGEPICECPIHECDDVSTFPVCADGITFKSVCNAHMHMCTSQKRITVQHVGQCGLQECGTRNPCPFHGRCGNGVCLCERCRDVDARREFDVGSSHRISVCGSDGVIYESECHLRYQSCTSRTYISIAKNYFCHRRRSAPGHVNHLEMWMHGRHDTEEEDFNVDEFGGLNPKEPCAKYELRGCLPTNHRGNKHLGVYSMVPGRRHLGSPVYNKLTSFRHNTKKIHLSRYVSPRAPNGSWAIGSKVGSGRGWFGVYDSSATPENITGLWYSTAGPRENPWQLEPKVYGRCVGSKPLRVFGQKCKVGEERRALGTNLQSLRHDTPLYELQIQTRDGDEIKYYQPGKRVVVEVLANNRAQRFTDVYVSIHNDIEDCGLPELKRSLRKLTVHCGGRVISKSGKRMKRVEMQLIAPPRGCLTFRALVVSVRGEVFYDDVNSSQSSFQTPLTQKVCHRMGDSL